MMKDWLAARAGLLCLGAALLLVPACRDDEIVASYTCGDGVCSAEEDRNSCPQDCMGPQYPGPCTGDGTALAIGYEDKDLLFEYELLEEGQAVTLSSDSGPYGVENAIQRYVFDANENLTAIEDISMADGSTQGVQLFFYDAEGRNTAHEGYLGDRVELRWRTSHEYDATGFRARTYTEDFRAGTQDEEILYEWNADHTFCTENIDVGPNGTVNYVNLMTYDDAGNLTSLDNGRYDNQCDFYYDHASQWTIASGAYALIPYQQVERHDRLVEYRCIWQGDPGPGEKFYFDEFCNLIRSERYRGMSSEADMIFTYDYDCWQ